MKLAAWQSEAIKVPRCRPPPRPRQTKGRGCWRPCSVKQRMKPFSRLMAQGSAPSATELKQPLVMGPPPLLGSGWTFSRTRRPSLTLPLFVLVVCRPDWPDCWLIASQFEVVQVAGIKAKQCYPSFTYLEFNLSWNIFHRPVISFFLRPSSWNTSADMSKSIILMVSAWLHLRCKTGNSALS